MSKIHLHNNRLKHILLMFFVVLSLSPCTVKEMLSFSADLDYNRPLTKTKTSAPASVCVYTQQDVLVATAEAMSQNDQSVDPMALAQHDDQSRAADLSYNHYTHHFSGNSPPKYILYKRLKIAIA